MSSSPRIEKLSTEVINRIAAGEVVQRPSAALKELLENALDAGASSVQVLVQGGGLDVLQVTDDGSGVQTEDLPLLCERYATSKLRRFEDLQCISSFGFRGEALASLSYVSHVTVTTKCRPKTALTTTTTSSTAGSGGSGTAAVAWRASYLDGKLLGAPEPCAGNVGTIIRAEKMFYNATVRRNALKESEEWGKLVDVVARYALAFPAIGFSCRRMDGGSGGGGQALSLPCQSTMLSNLRIAYGNAFASHARLVYYCEDTNGANREDKAPPSTRRKKYALPNEDEDTEESPHNAEPSPKQNKKSAEEIFSLVEDNARAVLRLRGKDGEGAFSLVGYTSDSTLPNRKFLLCLFVNNRLIESQAVRRALEMVYSSVLTGGNRPFCVLRLTVPPDRIDVNVHPTKKEVCLLDEDAILGRLTELIRAALLEAATERQLDTMKLQRTATAALKGMQPLSSPAASGTSSLLPTSNNNNTTRTSTSTTTNTVHSSSDQVLLQLQQQVAKGTSSFFSQGGGGSSTQSNNTGFAMPGKAAVVVAPCTVVRMEPQKGALDRFLKPKPSPTTTTFTISSAPSSPASASMTAAQVQEVKAEPEEKPLDMAQVLASLHPSIKKEMPPPQDDDNEEEDKVEVPSAIIHSNDHGKRPLSDMAGSPSSHPFQLPSEEEEEQEDMMAEFKRFKKEISFLTSDACAHAPANHSTTTGTGGAAVLAGSSLSGAEDKSTVTSSSQVFAAVSDLLEVEQQQQQQQQRPLQVQDKSRTSDGSLREAASGSGVLPDEMPTLETRTLTSVATVVADLYASSTTPAQSFVDQLSYVGVVDRGHMLAQCGTSLLMLDTMQLVRRVVFQRIFLRWGDAALQRGPFLRLSQPVPVQQLLYLALERDTAAMSPPPPLLAELLEKQRQALGLPVPMSRLQHKPTKRAARAATIADDGDGDDVLLGRAAELLFDTKSIIKKEGESGDAVPPREVQPYPLTQKYARRLVRRLLAWREMLGEYFAVYITADGCLEGLPYGLNEHWPPAARAVPLFLWLLAEAVPYPTPGRADPTKEEEEKPYTIEDAEKECEEERKCFCAIAEHIANVLYGLIPPPLAASTDTSTPASSSGNRNDNNTYLAPDKSQPTLEEAIPFALMPCVKNKKLFLPPSDLIMSGTSGGVSAIVSVEALYKVFERC